MIASTRSAVARASVRDFREAAEDVRAGFQRYRLLVEAGAIAFRALLALLTGALCVLGLLGLLNLGALWHDELAPTLRDNASQAGFTLISDTVLYILREEQLFWVTAGFALAVWQSSSVVRAAGEILNRIYEIEETRSGSG